MEAIRIWLNGKRDYKTGVRLYMIYGSDPALKRSFAENVISEYKEKRLMESLEAILVSSPKQSPSPSTTAKPVIRTPGIVTTLSGHKSPVLQPEQIPDFTPEKSWNQTRDATEEALHANWKPLFLELMNLTSRVGDMARAGKTDPLKKIEAGRMALRICDLDDQLDEIYKVRDQYKQSGQLPDQKPYGEPCIDFKQMPVKLANHQRYVREYRGKLEKNPADLKSAEQLKKHQWFVDHYKKELNLS